MLADAIGRVAVVENRLVQVGTDLSELGAAQVGIEEVAERLQRQVASVQATLEQILGEEVEEEPDGTELVDWSSLDQKTAEVEWARLYDWLDGWLVPTYEITITDLLTCWPHHAEVREQLSWLRVCWAQAYKRPRASGSLAAEWHMRWLPSVRKHLKEHFRAMNCTAGTHRGTTLPEWARALDIAALSRRHCWLDDGREADIAARAA